MYMASKMQLDFHLLVDIEMTVMIKNEGGRNTRKSFDSQGFGDYYCCSFSLQKEFHWTTLKNELYRCFSSDAKAA